MQNLPCQCVKYELTREIRNEKRAPAACIREIRTREEDLFLSQASRRKKHRARFSVGGGEGREKLQRPVPDNRGGSRKDVYYSWETALLPEVCEKGQVRVTNEYRRKLREVISCKKYIQYILARRATNKAPGHQFQVYVSRK